jgi:hypothetical protein
VRQLFSPFLGGCDVFVPSGLGWLSCTSTPRGVSRQGSEMMGSRLLLWGFERRYWERRQDSSVVALGTRRKHTPSSADTSELMTRRKSQSPKKTE